ncbi:nucleotide pyrophosphohydrolase [Methanosphaera sp.]|uniref:nucleotide pyrophosphohydrolase n=1 Tax=Methanosphaera sp. TaxID=2666342 RepID=UPI0025EE861B|nr:nucleotide pyrophosphohydrolase [Methanosphaera sp.]MEE1117837.1 nucleotide pyrophosphohydrolase [Methanosphaera sp.]MEE3324345.1 nucleotide pyrophosphohydrolase [Methanosphaera sp.]MEE3418212.1 nucleotide pyrophosphohydrolase [Methanosphaera sp.]
MEEVIERIIKFRDDRDWKQFQTLENLAKSISIESAELLENFQWDNDYDIKHVEEELADVLIYSYLMAITMNVDVKEIMLKKIEKNEEKYPIEKSKGKSTKYTELLTF